MSFSSYMTFVYSSMTEAGTSTRTPRSTGLFLSGRPRRRHSLRSQSAPTLPGATTTKVLSIDLPPSQDRTPQDPVVPNEKFFYRGRSPDIHPFLEIIEDVPQDTPGTVPSQGGEPGREQG